MTFALDAAVAERDLDISLRVAEGETLAILGPNGAGKSTLLSVAAGLVRPDRGTVLLGDRLLTSVAMGRSAAWVAPHRRRIALLAQEALLFPHLSVLDNVAFGPRAGGARRRVAGDIAGHWLAEVEAGHLAARMPGELSGGEAQRVAVARALATDPELLLLDEPMAALDVALTPALRQTLRRVLADRTAIVVTHDALDAFLLADRVVVLEAGRVVEAGTSQEVLVRPRTAFTARLTGLNLLVGTWTDGHVQLSSGAAVAPGAAVTGIVAGAPPVDGDRVAAAFRPGAVAVYRQPAQGSPRNSFRVTISEMEPLGDLFRVRAGALSADVTAQSVAQLDLAPGTEVTFMVKATEVTAYRF